MLNYNILIIKKCGQEKRLMFLKIFQFYFWHSIFKRVIHYSLLEFENKFRKFINLENLYETIIYFV